MNRFISLPEWAHTNYYGNTVEQYLLAALTLVTLVVIFVLFKNLVIGRMKKWSERTKTDFDDFVVKVLSQIGMPTFVVIALFLATVPLDLSASAGKVLKYVLIFTLTIRAILILQEIVRYAIQKSYAKARPNDPSGNVVVSNLANVVSVALWALGAIFILDNLGVNISTLVAGLGIGGIAVAMASQAILGDLFSAVAIFTDKPFEVGDFIIVDNYMGTVEYVGLKTTRIRSLDGEQIIFGNADLTKGRIKNYKRMQARRILFKFGVTYDTPTEKLAKIPAMIKEIVAAQKDLRLDRAHFQAFADYSLTFEVVYFVDSPDYNTYMDRQHAINLALKDRFAKEGIDFAFPTQTINFPAGASLQAPPLRSASSAAPLSN